MTEQSELVKNIQQWVILIGSVVGGIASAWNWWWVWRSKAQEVRVGFGPLSPPIEPGYWLHVLSRSEHQLLIKDFGFIDESGALLSLPRLWTDDPESSERPLIHGDTLLKLRGDLFEVGPIVLRDKQIGAYAVTVEKDGYTLGFNYDVPWFQRCRIKCKLWWKPVYR